jgi:hypothetical protein
MTAALLIVVLVACFGNTAKTLGANPLHIRTKIIKSNHNDLPSRLSNDSHSYVQEHGKEHTHHQANYTCWLNRDDQC